MANILPTLEQVVLTALEKDPHRRFGSMQAFANAFERASRITPLSSPSFRDPSAGSPSDATFPMPSDSSGSSTSSTILPDISNLSTLVPKPSGSGVPDAPPSRPSAAEQTSRSAPRTQISQPPLAISASTPVPATLPD